MDEMIWGSPKASTPQGFMFHRQSEGRVHRGGMTPLQARNYLGYKTDFVIVDEPKNVDVSIGHTEMSLDEETVRATAEKVSRAVENQMATWLSHPNCRCGP